MLWSESGVTAVTRWTWGLGASHANSETVVARWTMSLGADLLSTQIREIFYWNLRKHVGQGDTVIEVAEILGFYSDPPV